MTSVHASVYHLATDRYNSVLSALGGVGGLYHVGIEIYGIEWSYGFCESGSGVFAVEPTQCSLGPFKESVYLGNVSISADEIITILRRLRSNWMGRDYSILNKNCIGFCREFIGMLSPKLLLPEYVCSMANVGLAVGGSRSKQSIPKSKEDLFGSPEKELMWKTAEKLMREAGREDRPTVSLCKILHARSPMTLMSPLVSHPPSKTWQICRSSFQHVVQDNRLAYERHAVTRHVLRAHTCFRSDSCL